MVLKESDGDVEFAQFPENHRFQIPVKDQDLFDKAFGYVRQYY